MPISPASLFTNPYFYAAVASVGITATVWVQFARRAMPSPTINWLKAIMTCGVILNTYMVWLFFITDRTRLVWLNNFYILFLGILMVATIYFAINYIGKSAWLKHMWIHVGIVAPTIAIVCLSIAQPGLVFGDDYSMVRWAPWGAENTANPPLFGLYVGWLAVYSVVHNVLLIWSYVHNKSRKYRRRTLLVIVADNIPMMAALFGLGILPSLGIHILPLSTYANSITFGLLRYALTHYGSAIFDPNLITSGIVRTMSSAALVIDSDNRVVYANQAAGDLFGAREAGKLVDRHAASLFPADTLQLLTGSNATAGTSIGVMESNILVHGHPQRAVNIYSSYFLDHTGHILGTVLVLADIQHIKDLLDKAERLGNQLQEEKANVEKTVTLRTQQLAEEKARFTASVNSLRFGFILTDEKDEIIYTNTALENIIDTQGHKSYQSLLAKLDKIAHLSNLIRECRLGKRSSDTSEVQYNNKTLRFLLAPVSSETDSHKTIGTVIMIEDITEAKSFERSRDEFFSIASHELRTPLTTIRGNTSMLLQLYGKDIGADQRGMIEDVHDSSVRLIKIVNDFLDTSRLEQGRISYNLVSLKVYDVINYVVKDIAKTLPHTGVEIVIDPSLQALPPILGDTDRCKQVVYSLVDNALKFTHDGTITISGSSTKQHARIVVSDTGQGIPPERQGLLFHKFQQASADIYTRDTTRSTGLGLYVSSLIIKQMGGKLQLDHSEVNKGTAFSFTLPLAPKNS